MAALIRPLAVAGSRKSDGTANASGKVFLYEPGTTTIVPGYRDEELLEAWTTVAGGIPLDAGGKVEIWLNDVVDVVVTDADGETVDTWADFNVTRAEQVQIENDNYTGAVTDPVTGAVTQDLGGKIDLDTLLTRAVESLGPDFKYQESTGATPRPYIEVVRQIHITPQDFGALGNGIKDDTSAIVRAITELNRLDGGTLYWGPGTYRITDDLELGTLLVNAAGINFVGAGSGATVIRQDTAGTNIFTAYATGLRVKGMTLTHLSTSTGVAVSIASGSGVILEDVVTDGKFRTALLLDGTSNVMSSGCTWSARDADASARGIHIASGAHIRFIGDDIKGGATGIGAYVSQYQNGAGDLLISGCRFSNSGTGVAFISDPFAPGTFNGTGFSIIGCPTLGDLSVPLLTTDVIPGDLIQIGNHIEGRTANILTGATFTPTPQYTGRVQRARGTTTGSAYIIAAPAYTPTKPGYTFVLECVNAAGGAVTGWDFTTAAVYKTNGAVTTDLHTTSLTFLYDVDASVWREIARTDTVT